MGYESQAIRDPQTDTTIVVFAALPVSPDGRGPASELTRAVMAHLPTTLQQRHNQRAGVGGERLLTAPTSMAASARHKRPSTRTFRWAQRDLNPRLLACKASALTKLSYTPVRASDCTFGGMSDPVADSPVELVDRGRADGRCSWPRRSPAASGHRSTWSRLPWNGHWRCSRASTASRRSGLTKRWPRRNVRAQDVAAGRPLGVLHGVPVAIKDTSPAAGHLTTFGSHAFADYVPDHDAYVVGALRRAGAIIIGQTTTPEFAHTLRTDSPLLGRHPQPAPPRSHAGRVFRRQRGGRRLRMRAARRGQRHGRLGAHPGGVVRRSSASSQASGGSRWTSCPRCSTRSPITDRWPAAPTTLVCSWPPRRARTTPTSSRSLDRSISRARSILTSGACAWRCPSTSGAGLVDEEIAAAVTAMAEQLAAAGAEVDVVDPGVTPDDEAAWVELWWVFMAANYGELVAAHRERMDPEVLQLIAAGEAMSAVRYKRLERVRTSLWHRLRSVLAGRDALLCPTMAQPPWPAAKADGVPAPPPVRRLRLAGHDVGLQPRGAVPGPVRAVRPARIALNTPAFRSGCRSSDPGGGRTSCCASPAPSKRSRPSSRHVSVSEDGRRPLRSHEAEIVEQLREIRAASR